MSIPKKKCVILKSCLLLVVYNFLYLIYFFMSLNKLKNKISISFPEFPNYSASHAYQCGA